MSDLPNVQPYLKSICDRYVQWWKAYAFMDEIDASTWFEFELTSRTEDKSKSSEKKPPDKLPPQPVLQAIENYANEKILIVGSSGAGKSTLLAQIFWQAAERARHDETAPIPVLVELKAYQLVGDRSGIRGLILDSLESHDPSLDSDDLKKLLKNQRLLLLVDGLNELQQAQAKIDLKRFCLNIPLIATARHAGDGWEIERKLELQPLSQHQVSRFLEIRLPTSDRARLQELRDRVQDFGQTPLMVWMLYCIFRTDDEIPETRGETYRKFTNLYVERSKEGIDLDESLFLLSRLAFGMMQSQKPNDPTDFQLDISEVNAQNLLGSEKELKLLRNCHLLQSFGKSGKHRLRFCHQSLQEYYAAEYVLTQLPKLLENQQGNDDLKSAYLNYRKWTEPVALMLGLVESEVQAVQVVKLGLEVDWMLGARLAGKVCESIQFEAVDLIVKESSTEHFRLHLLGLTRSNAILPPIAQALESEDTNICLTAVMILAKLGTKPALGMLVRVLDHRSSDVRKSAAVKLAEVADHSVSQFTISTLISRLLNKSEAPEIRSSCVSALGKTKNQIAKCILQNVISDPLEDVIVRANATNALVETDLQSAFIYLERALKDKDVSWYASISLAHIGGRTAESILCEALLDNDPNSRMNAAFGLASMNCKTACASLTRALQDQLTKALQDELSNPEPPYYLWHLQAFHANVITRLIDAIGHLECTDALRNLLTLYEHKDLNVQMSTVKAIGKIQKKKAIPLLAKLLDELSCITDSEDRESFSRAIVVSPAVAEGLGKTECIEALFILKKALSSQNAFVRASVISGLEKLRLKETLPILLNALSDPNEGVRERVAMVFDNLGENFIDKGDCQIIFALSNYLEDKNATVRKHITQSLWRIGGEAVSISQFITALQDTEPMSRMSAARRLGQIADKSDEISSALLDALEDEDVGVQTCAAEALGKIANPKLILQLYQSQLKHQRKYVSDAISAIQENCRYYNYEIFQAYLEAQKSDRQTSQSSDRSPITQNFYAPVNAVAGNVEGNLITPPPNSVE